jgi:hypothetical protein
MPIHEEALLQELAVNVIAQAIRDLKAKRDPARALDALHFITSEDFELWATTAGAEHINPWKMLCIGGARKLKA